MDIADLDALTADVDRLRASWASRLVGRVVETVGDARVHAGNVLTDRLADAADGRTTAGIAWQHRSAQAAVRKIRGLHDWLCGPTVRSLDGKLRDFRESAYRRAFQVHRAHIPESIRVSSDPQPTAANIAVVRGYPLHGLDLRLEIGGIIERTLRQLRSALTSAGASDMSPARQRDILDAWGRATADALTRAVLASLSDSMVWVISESRDDQVDPQFREE